MWTRVAYRIAAWDTPLWALANRRAGRFNHAGQGQTQYFGIHPLTPWAEVARDEEVIERADLDQLRLALWAVHVILAEDPLQITFDDAASWGLRAEDLVADDRTACQGLAERLRSRLGPPPALIVPSAALPGTENLVVLGPRVKIGYLDHPIDEGDVPVSVAAERAIPPVGLESLIHPRNAGAQHPALAAWRSGDSFEFSEPPTDHLVVPGSASRCS